MDEGGWGKIMRIMLWGEAIYLIVKWLTVPLWILPWLFYRMFRVRGG